MYVAVAPVLWIAVSKIFVNPLNGTVLNVFSCAENTHCLLTYSYKGYASGVDLCCCVNIKATIKANRVITVTAIAGNTY